MSRIRCRRHRHRRRRRLRHLRRHRQTVVLRRVVQARASDLVVVSVCGLDVVRRR